MPMVKVMDMEEFDKYQNKLCDLIERWKEENPQITREELMDKLVVVIAKDSQHRLTNRQFQQIWWMSEIRKSA